MKYFGQTRQLTNIGSRKNIESCHESENVVILYFMTE